MLEGLQPSIPPLFLAYSKERTNKSRDASTYQVQDLVFGETIFAELSQEELKLLGRCAVQVREVEENAVDFFWRDLVINTEEFLDFFRLDCDVDVEQGRDIENHFHRGVLADLLCSLQIVKEKLDLAF